VAKDCTDKATAPDPDEPDPGEPDPALPECVALAEELLAEAEEFATKPVDELVKTDTDRISK